ncbi:MAG: pseudouridine synthase [Desulfobacterales bacterium CG23_combo_of_CG06-09_8_20_14_all_51_8]|nr:MAG: pseudouridine synthase [Desulfobacterales bacterium CG23_combo_of_CG06-09_8_20_14_all_51_8]
MRLQKYLSMAGVCSRRMGEEYILAGRVKVNGEVVTELGTQVDPEKDRVAVDGKIIREQDEKIYIMLNKPAGYITSRSHRGEKIVFDLIDIRERLNPVGRLDRDSTGLLLLTNDGPLHHRLIHPSFDHEKEYQVETLRSISDSALETLRRGVVVDDKKTRPAKILRLSLCEFKITLKEGRKRQIRRMVEKVDHHVKSLHRIRMASLHLGDLKMGKWRHLSKAEVKKLLASAGL